MPVISVVVPVYKVERYLHECVDSLLAQTFEDIEIILVDDGSPDTCGVICDEYAKKDSRVRVIHQKNAGLSVARNTGAAHALGTYVCFVDSDDYVAPSYCETLYALVKDCDCDFSVCGVCRFKDGTKPVVAPSSDEMHFVANTELLRMQLEKKSEFGVWNKLYRREVFDKIQFAPWRIHEDVIWSGDLARCLHKGVVITDRQLYYYRQRSGSIVHAEKCSPDRLYAGEYLIETAKQSCPALLDDCLRYAAEYPFMLVDGIYVRREFTQNRAFLSELQSLLRKYRKAYAELSAFSPVLRKRMMLFATSRVLYGLNAYARLARVYLYHILGKDAYADGHGI